MIYLTLPKPPSVNEAYAGYPRRHKSDKYKAWEVEARKALKTQEKYTIEGDEWLNAMYVFWADLHYKNGKKKVIDVGNLEKILSDFLCHEIPGLEDHKFLTITLIKKQKTAEKDSVDIAIDEINLI